MWRSRLPTASRAGNARSSGQSRSSRGPGHCPFTAATGVRIPYGTPILSANWTIAGTICPISGLGRPFILLVTPGRPLGSAHAYRIAAPRLANNAGVYPVNRFITRRIAWFGGAKIRQSSSVYGYSRLATRVNKRLPIALIYRQVTGAVVAPHGITGRLVWPMAE